MEKVMTIRPPEKLKLRLKEEAVYKGFTVNQLVLQILWEWVKRKEEV